MTIPLFFFLFETTPLLPFFIDMCGRGLTNRRSRYFIAIISSFHQDFIPKFLYFWWNKIEVFLNFNGFSVYFKIDVAHEQKETGVSHQSESSSIELFNWVSLILMTNKRSHFKYHKNSKWRFFVNYNLLTFIWILCESWTIVSTAQQKQQH